MPPTPFPTMPPPDPLAARARSCLLGGILGDALGSAHEGAAPDHAAPRREPAPTDDTQLTLATCEALLACNGEVDPEAIAEAAVRWFRAGWLTGVGSSTLKALRDLAAGMHWALSGAQGDRTAGNGAAMRIAPVALLVDPISAAGRRSILDVARITHRHGDTDTNASMAGQILGCVRPPREADCASGFSVGCGAVGDTVARFADLVARRGRS